MKNERGMEMAKREKTKLKGTGELLAAVEGRARATRRGGWLAPEPGPKDGRMGGWNSRRRNCWTETVSQRDSWIIGL